MSKATTLTQLELHALKGANYTDKKFSELSSNVVALFEELSLGIASDGLIYIFVNGSPVGSGIQQSAGVEGDVFGYVDENNTIVLNGKLEDGTYKLKYEMENGTTVDIGNMVLDTNVYYSVTNNLTNCTINNSAKSVVEGGSYSAVISANDGYELKSVSVIMGGSPVTVTGGNINIASVTGDIVITAVAEEVQAAEPVTEDITILKETSLVLDGTDRANTTGYCATVAVDVSNLPKPCTIHLTGARWTNGSAADSSYIRTYIEDASGNKLIGDYTYPTRMPSGVTMTRNNDTDSDVTVTVTSDNIGKLRFAGYWSWSGIGDENQGGTVMVAKATLTYTPNGVATEYAVTTNLTNCVISNSAKSVVEGDSYSAVISSNDGYELKSVSVTMGGSPVTVSGGVINISNVTGNIVITAVAEVVKTETNFAEYNSTNTSDWNIWINNARIGSDGLYRSDTVSADYGTPVVSNWIEVQNGDIIEVSGLYMANKASGAYKSDKSLVQAAVPSSATTAFSNVTLGNASQYNGTFKINNANVKYIRVGGYIYTPSHPNITIKIKRNGEYL